jgi:hypothetical protein
MRAIVHTSVEEGFHVPVRCQRCLPEGLLRPQYGENSGAGSALPRNVSVEGKGPATMGEIATVAEEDLVQLEVGSCRPSAPCPSNCVRAHCPPGLFGHAGCSDLRPLWVCAQAIFERQDEDEDEWHIEIQREKYTEVKICCLKLDLPVLEEYDFANDTSTDPLDIEAKPGTFIRSYQEKALSKMFSHGRARSGFIVLPCGAGKTLVGITAVANIKKCAVVVCNTNLAVMQWKEQFMRTWTNVKERDITCLVSGGDDLKKVHPCTIFHVSARAFSGTSTGLRLPRGAMQHRACCSLSVLNRNLEQGLGNLLITTYPMMVERKDRAKDTETLLEKIKSRQWGILVLDEVHLSFAEKYFRIVDTCKAHCKLGLTATLVREDDKISELKNLIGPKLYEADWQDLSNQGYLARVQCVEAHPLPPARGGPWARVAFARVRSCRWRCHTHTAGLWHPLAPRLELMCRARVSGVVSDDTLVYEAVPGERGARAQGSVDHEPQQAGGGRVPGQVLGGSGPQDPCFQRRFAPHATPQLRAERLPRAAGD